MSLPIAFELSRPMREGAAGLAAGLSKPIECRRIRTSEGFVDSIHVEQGERFRGLLRVWACVGGDLGQDWVDGGGRARRRGGRRCNCRGGSAGRGVSGGSGTARAGVSARA